MRFSAKAQPTKNSPSFEGANRRMVRVHEKLVEEEGAACNDALPLAA